MKLSSVSRQVLAILACVFLGPLFMITSTKYADVVRYELKEVKEEGEDEN